MSSEGKKIEQVFREKAGAFNPGSSMLEADWAAISGQLPVSGEVAPAKKPVVLWWRAAAAVAALLLLFFAIRGFNNRKKEVQPVVKAAPQKAITPLPVLPDTLQMHKAPDYPVSYDSLLARIKGSLPLLKSIGDYATVILDTLPKEELINAVKHNDAANNNPLPQYPSPRQMLAVLYRQAAPQAQTFTINNSQPTTITGHGGTTVYIPANTFYSGNAPVSGEVTFALTEYYSLGDMAAAKLNTTAAGQLLKSGGMLFMSASYNGQEVNIGPAYAITVNMPAAKDFDPEMQLFLPQTIPQQLYADSVTGDITTNAFEWMPAGQIQSLNKGDSRSGADFTNRSLPLVNVPTLKAIQPYRIKGQTATFMTGYLDSWEKDSIKKELGRRFPGYSIKLRNTLFGQRKFRYREDTASYKGMEDFYNTANRTGLPLYIDAVTEKSYVSFEYALSKHLLKPADSIKLMREYEQQQHYVNGIGMLQKKYSFSINKLGWINCDRFYYDTREKVNLQVYTEINPGDCVVQVIVPGINGIMMRSNYTDNSSVFVNLPLGEPICIVVVGVKEGKTVASFTRTTVSHNPVTNLVFEDIAGDELKQKLKQLDSGQ